MSPATAATTRRDGEGGGYCRKWTTAAWRNWRVKDPRTALLQVRQRQDERKRTSVLSLPPSLHLSLPPYIQNSAGDEKKKSETNDHPTCSVFLPPHPPVFTAWCGVTQIVRSGDFPWARAIAGGDILAVSAVFTVVLCHVFLGSCRFSPHSLPPIPLLTLSSSLPSPSSVFPSCFSPIVARSQGKKKNPCFHGDLLSYHQPATSVWSAQGQHVRMLKTSCLESSKSLSPNKRGEIRHV